MNDEDPPAIYNIIRDGCLDNLVEASALGGNLQVCPTNSEGGGHYKKLILYKLYLYFVKI